MDLPLLLCCIGVDDVVFGLFCNWRSHMAFVSLLQSFSVRPYVRPVWQVWSREVRLTLRPWRSALNSTARPFSSNEQLSKYKVRDGDGHSALTRSISTWKQGLAWYDFLAQFEERRPSGSSMVSGYRLSQPSCESRRSSGQTNLSTPVVIAHPPPSPQKKLLRTQTFDSTNSGDQDNQLAINAHSTRSHSCVAPVNIDIRRLSRGAHNQSSLESQDITESFDSGDLNPSPPHSLTSARSSIMLTRSEQKRREALWDLFQSESVFLLWSFNGSEKRLYGTVEEDPGRRLCNVSPNRKCFSAIWMSFVCVYVRVLQRVY